jgi:hypothetical protein
MKKSLLIVCLLFITLAKGQEKDTIKETPKEVVKESDKIKGSKIVTIEQREIETFTSLEVEDDFEVLLIKGSKQGLEVEADDNLHEVISTNVVGGILYIRKQKKITSAKKVSIRVTYTDDLKTINCRNKSKITALATIELTDLKINGFEDSKIFLNADVAEFLINANDKTEIELNLKSDHAKIVLDKNASMKALINAKKIDFDMYQKTEAIIEGDCDNLQLRMDNNARFKGQNMVTKNLKILAEMSTETSIQHLENATVESRGKAKIYFYGKGKITLNTFEDEASIYKKSLSK